MGLSVLSYCLQFKQKGPQWAKQSPHMSNKEVLISSALISWFLIVMWCSTRYPWHELLLLWCITGLHCWSLLHNAWTKINLNGWFIITAHQILQTVIQFLCSCSCFCHMYLETATCLWQVCIKIYMEQNWLFYKNNSVFLNSYGQLFF